MVLIDTDNPPIGYAIQREDGGEEEGQEIKHTDKKMKQTQEIFQKKNIHGGERRDTHIWF